MSLGWYWYVAAFVLFITGEMLLAMICIGVGVVVEDDEKRVAR